MPRRADISAGLRMKAGIILVSAGMASVAVPGPGGVALWERGIVRRPPLPRKIRKKIQDTEVARQDGPEDEPV